MTIEIKYIDDGIGVEFIGSGTVKGADVVEARKEVYSNQNFSKQRYQIVDRSKVTDFQVNSAEVMTIAEQDMAAAKINPNILVALISPTDLQYGISRMYEAFIGDSTFVTKVFKDRKSAEEWIAGELEKRR
ncbi:MAG: hypothetical protein KJP07_14240 [Desulfatitalea sp.]|nr:hypothetical protein [Desulfatitalea sp.]